MSFPFTGRPVIGGLRRPDRAHAQADPQSDSRRQASTDDRLLSHAPLLRRQENGGKHLISFKEKKVKLVFKS